MKNKTAKFAYLLVILGFINIIFGTASLFWIIYSGVLFAASCIFLIIAINDWRKL